MSEEQEVKQLSPQEIEDKLLEEAQNQVPHSHADAAAAFFKMRLPNFIKLVNALSRNQMRRVLVNVVGFPFAGDNYNPQSKIEHDAAYHFSELLNYKMVMQLEYEVKKAEEADKKLKEEQETSASIEAGEKNA